MIYGIYFCIGVITGFWIMALVGYFTFRVLLKQEPLGNMPPPTNIFSKKSTKRRKPVSVSDEEQWKREQTKPPLDPGLG